MRKLLLVNPVGRRSGYLRSSISTFAPLGLAYVAAVTPGHWEVKIADENLRPCADEDADLVGITAFTSNVNRAYALARRYRERGTKVVLGGIHASMLPQEARRFADAVVVGEVEGIWGSVLRDFERNRLQPIYQGPRLDLENDGVVPRRDLLDPGYFWQSVQTSRGCPFACDFCSVTRYLGAAYRQRPVARVLEELAGIPGRFLTFVDDNLIGHSPKSRERAAELFRGMAERGLDKRWWMQTSINAAEDETLVAAAARAGCLFVFIGFESIRTATLKGMRKGANLRRGIDNYRAVIDTFHRHGIAVLGAFIIGNDGESPDYYRELGDFILRAGIDMAQISILTPLPGTRFMERMEQEGRLVHRDFPADWDKYRFSYVVHQPQGLDAERIYAGDNLLKSRLYRAPGFYLRLAQSLFRLGKIAPFAAAYRLNRALKKSWQGAHYYRRVTHD